MIERIRVVSHILMLVVVVMCSYTAYGQGLPDKWSTTVSVEVQTDVTQLRSDITSYINRELHSLGDVSITNSMPIYVIEIVAIEITKDRQPIGAVALSVLIKRPLGRGYLDMWLKGKTESSIVENLAKYYADGTEGISHSVRFGSVSDLPRICREIITDFDAETLIPARRTYNAFMEQQRELRQQRKE